jgi:hypothetical protein
MAEEALEPKKRGALELHLEWVWAELWKAFEAGQTYEFYLAQSEAEISHFRSRLTPGDAPAEKDLRAAETYDRAQRQHFLAMLKDRNDQRVRLVAIYDALLTQLMRQSHFVMQSLALAHGSAVLAAISYLGREGAKGSTFPLILVLIFCGFGFLLTLAMAQLGVLRAKRPMEIILTLSSIRVPEEQIPALTTEFTACAQRNFRTSFSMGSCSALLLAAAIVVGTVGIL